MVVEVVVKIETVALMILIKSGISRDNNDVFIFIYSFILFCYFFFCETGR